MAGIRYDHPLAQAIVDTIREPLLVLDDGLRVVAANRSFFRTFKVNRQNTEGQFLYALGHNQWDIPALRARLTEIAHGEGALEDYEVVWDFPTIGRRAMLLNARKVFYEHGDHSTILLAFEDVTERRAAEFERDQLLHEKDLLLQEMQHRVANSLQIIASILLMKARTVGSEETRTHLHEAHKRVLAVAAVQSHLRAATGSEIIEMRPYLTKLCASLAGSMIGEDKLVSIAAKVDDSGAKASDAVSIGLIVTELVINALKHAFPIARPKDAIVVAFEAVGPEWRLRVCDNGAGAIQPKIGLGTSIVAALADQLHARVESRSSAAGMSVSISRSPLAAAQTR